MLKVQVTVILGIVAILLLDHVNAQSSCDVDCWRQAALISECSVYASSRLSTSRRTHTNSKIRDDVTCLCAHREAIAEARRCLLVNCVLQDADESNSPAYFNCPTGTCTNRHAIGQLMISK